jgi:hypothetical protein
MKAISIILLIAIATLSGCATVEENAEKENLSESESYVNGAMTGGRMALGKEISPEYGTPPEDPIEREKWKKGLLHGMALAAFSSGDDSEPKESIQSR